MPQRNPTGGLLFLALAAAGGLFLASRKKKDGAAWPGEGVTGWAVNTLCTNADMVDAEAAVTHADNWYESGRAPPLPISPSPAAVGTLTGGIAAALDRYFSTTFPQCERAPSSLLFGDDVLEPGTLAAQTAQMLQRASAGEGVSGGRLHHFAAALVGH